MQFVYECLDLVIGEILPCDNIQSLVEYSFTFKPESLKLGHMMCWYKMFILCRYGHNVHYSFLRMTLTEDLKFPLNTSI